MARYIDAISTRNNFQDNLAYMGSEVKRILNISTTADVVEVKHGEWKVYPDEYEICASEFVCSVCKESFCSSDLTDEQFFEMMKYCPNCGAKMDVEKALKEREKE